MIGRDYTPNDGHTLTIDDFENLREGERFFLVVPNIGEGDYIIQITPEMMLDFDLRENRIVLDTDKISCSYFRIFRKFCCDEYDSPYVYSAEFWGHRYKEVFPSDKGTSIRAIPLRRDERLIGITVDDHCPTARNDVMKLLKEMY